MWEKIKMANAYKFSQMMSDNFQNAYKYFGESKHGATIIACSIAVFKGLFRPIFTLMDKKSDPETKKYAALREGLTEAAALPIYAVTPWIAGKLVEKFTKETNELVKGRMKTNAKFFAICASTLIIPAICNLVQPPIMNALKKKQEAKKLAQVNNIAAPVQVNQPSFSGKQVIPPIGANKVNYGMRVGS